jgi:hypothetical protein
MEKGVMIAGETGQRDSVEEGNAGEGLNIVAT